MSKTPVPIAFDADYYLRTNSDLTEDLDLPMHYQLYGWREGRDPSPYFDSAFYARRNHGFDSVRSDPLKHYNEVGRFNGRKPRPENLYVLSELPLGDVSAQKVAVHCRIADLSLWPEICDLLAEDGFSHPIVLSTNNQADFDGALRYAQKYEGFSKRLSCVIVPADCLDIEALLFSLGGWLDQFDVWGNVYTAWQVAPETRGFALSQTIGTHAAMASYIDQLVGKAPAGLVFYEQGREARNAEQGSLERWPNYDPDRSVPGGSMIWARSDILREAAARWSENTEAKRRSDDYRRTKCLQAICDASTAKGLGYYAVRAAILRPEMLVKPASSARQNGDQRGERWRAFSPAITDNRPLPLSDVPSPINSQRIDLHWVIPDYSEGGGGHMTIFRFVRLLEQANFRQTIWIQNAFNHPTTTVAKERIQSWYQPISDDVIVRFLPDDVEAITGDAVIATDCWTAFPVSRMTRFKERFYFIQDWETEFHPAGDLRLAASLTHQFGFTALTAGKWLEQKATQAGMDVVGWTLGADRTNYHPKQASQISDAVFQPRSGDTHRDLYRARKIKTAGQEEGASETVTFEYRKNGNLVQPDDNAPGIAQIALYARGFTPRRAVDLAIAGLKSLASRGWLFHVHLYGEEKDFGDLPFLYTPHGLMDPKSLGRIYAKCDLGVAFSATNYSLVPLEMMVSDIPVVEIDTESTRAAYPEDAVVRAAPAAYAIADALEALLADPGRRRALIEAGRKFLEVSDWTMSAKIVGDAISARVIAKSSIDVSDTIRQVKARSASPPIMPAPALASKPAASIFIPTYNAGADFDVVLQAIAEQTFDAPFELVIIDSGSADETLDLVRKWSDRIRTNVISISNMQFGHGRTRNQGIDMSEGEYVAILTQDACPASPTWLQNLVNGFGAGDRIAGVFGRHIAYPIHDLFEGQGLRDFFESFRLIGPLYSLDDDLPGYVHRGTPNWQSALQFYSDNNSCMRKSVWKTIPYRDVPWGEDQVWAWEVVRLGFQKAYAHDAAVYHSHDYLSKKLLQVGAEEGRMFIEHFGMYIGIDEDRRDATDAIISMVRGSVAADAKLLAGKDIVTDALLLRRAMQHLALFFGRSDGVTQAKRAQRR